MGTSSVALRNSFYYGLKPFLPASMRLVFRRWLAGSQRRKFSHVWPILPGSETMPANWPGWPEGKKFALLLTHDVEGLQGLNKCPQLMALEKERGFCSGFYFIPEGEYRVPADLRNTLQSNGFEVGVHDLHHDGKLFRERSDFARKAAKINGYLKEWGAVGFRSGFMLHNLDWLGDLDVLYEASTFDTDPFEPQPDHVGTIFPFWQSRNERSASGRRDGFVELPYTLPQDSTLFLVLREKEPTIWCRKLDWIAKHGGMALVNVHPDYIQFEGQAPGLKTYPAERYSRFLDYVRQTYGDSFWQPRPRDLAAFVAAHRPELPRRPRRICMVTYSNYFSDARVSRYAETLAHRGDRVDVVNLKRSVDQPDFQELGNVRTFSLQARVGRKERSRMSYLFPVARFLLAASRWVAKQHRREPYDLFHVHNVPDFLVFSALLPKLKGAKVILDIHDILPEFYASKFGVKDASPAVGLLRAVERISASVANHVIISNHLWRDKYIARTGKAGRCSVFINNVDGTLFRPRARQRADHHPILIFPGGLQWHQGLDIAIRAFAQVRVKMPTAEFHIYGEGSMKESLVALTGELGLDGSVRFFSEIPVRQIAEIMANADLGVVPKRADSFGNEAYSTKIMEFMSLGIPVVASNTKIDRYYFDDSLLQFFESGNPDSLAEAMLTVLQNPDISRTRVANARIYASRNSWDSRKAAYLDLVDSLIAGNQPKKDEDPAEGRPQIPAQEIKEAQAEPLSV